MSLLSIVEPEYVVIARQRLGNHVPASMEMEPPIVVNAKGEVAHMTIHNSAIAYIYAEVKQ
jgi:hypothetical protein